MSTSCSLVACRWVSWSQVRAHQIHVSTSAMVCLDSSRGQHLLLPRLWFESCHRLIFIHPRNRRSNLRLGFRNRASCRWQRLGLHRQHGALFGIARWQLQLLPHWSRNTITLLAGRLWNLCAGNVSSFLFCWLEPGSGVRILGPRRKISNALRRATAKIHRRSYPCLFWCTCW